MMKRRQFLDRTVKSSAFLATPSLVFQSTASFSPADQVNVGVIGTNGRGLYVCREMARVPGVNVTALCDVDTRQLDAFKSGIKESNDLIFSGLSTQDYRRVLDHREVDAVLIATPDHWHFKIAYDALRAGKHVYLEKPMTYNIEEASLLASETEKHQLVLEVGQQQRSGAHWKQLVEFIHNGQLGAISRVQCWANFNYGAGRPAVPDSGIPKELDYDMWLGPAPKQPYNRTRVESWRFQWDFGGGLMTDFGAHLLDIALWGMQVQELPEIVHASGGTYITKGNALETPDTLSVQYQFPSFLLTWDHLGGIQRGPFGRNYGVAFYGEHGIAAADRSGWEIIPTYGNENPIADWKPILKDPEKNSTFLHTENFIQAIREGTKVNCTVYDGQKAAVISHLGNAAFRSGKELRSMGKGWNPSHLPYASRTYRNPWKLPSE